VPSPRRAPDERRGAAGAPREALVVALVAGAVLLTALAGPLVLRIHEPPAWLQLDIEPGVVTPAPQPSAADLGLGDPQGMPAWVGEAIRWVGLLAAAVILALVLRVLIALLKDWWRGIDRGAGGASRTAGLVTDEQLDEEARAELERGVADAWRALRADLPPGDAVVAAWLALEKAAGECGVDRDPAATATEFTLSLLDRTPADPRAARTLLRLYHAARFSDHPVTERDVAAAGSALDTLAAGLAPVASRVARGDPGPGDGAPGSDVGDTGAGARGTDVPGGGAP
jgi:hypothetical protein